MSYEYAVPVWKRADGEQVYQVFFRYGDSPLCHQFMTANGSLDVKA